jgi:hypothetical protein
LLIIIGTRSVANPPDERVGLLVFPHPGVDSPVLVLGDDIDPEPPDAGDPLHGLRTPTSTLVDHALVRYAKEQGFDEQPPPR